MLLFADSGQPASHTSLYLKEFLGSNCSVEFITTLVKNTYFHRKNRLKNLSCAQENPYLFSYLGLSPTSLYKTIHPSNTWNHGTIPFGWRQGIIVYLHINLLSLVNFLRYHWERKLSSVWWKESEWWVWLCALTVVHSTTVHSSTKVSPQN